MKAKKLTIAMAGGGSGGHVYPIKSLIEFLNSHKEYRDHIEKIFWFGQKGKIEKKEYLSLDVKKELSCIFLPITSGKIRRQRDPKSILKNIRDIFIFFGAIFHSAYLLKKNKVNVIFCKGGYIAAPVVIAGAILRIKIVAHDSDTHPGLASRIATPFAKKVYTGFDNVFHKAETLGQILSHNIYFEPAMLEQEVENDETGFYKMLSKHRKRKSLVLVLGGSLGSKGLYNVLSEVLESNQQFQEEFTFIVVGGFINKDMGDAFKKYENVYTFDYLSQKQMGAACYYADIGFTRGGTTSLAEQKLYDMKLLICPIPWTHDQYDNAKYYVNHFSDILIDQNQNFAQQLELNLKHFMGFKKERKTTDIQEKLSEAKHIIRKELLSIKE